ncbi:MAG: undecaprenyl/decaprenyl-phosphate alpha-N-acetylglucosaminyl 1-phosphate transferase, partial [Planctomycetota bacterium]
MTELLVLSFGISFALSAAIVPVIRHIAIAIGLVDSPDAERKLHSRPIAVAGGVAVLIASLCSIVAIYFVDRVAGWSFLPDTIPNRWLVLLGGCLAIA